MKNGKILVGALIVLMLLTGCGSEVAIPPVSQPEKPDSSAADAAEPEEKEIEKEGDQEEQLFTSLELEISQGTLYISVGDSFSIVRNGEEVQTYRIEEETLYYKNDKGGDTKLTLPAGDSYEVLRMDVQSGHAYCEDGLTIQSLLLNAGRGEVKLEGISVSESSDIQVDQGSAFLSGDLGITVSTSCQEGNLQLKSKQAESDYDFEITLSEGELQLGGEHYHGKSTSRTISHDGERSMELICRRGNISVEFEK